MNSVTTVVEGLNSPWIVVLDVDGVFAETLKSTKITRKRHIYKLHNEYLMSSLPTHVHIYTKTDFVT